MALFHDKTFKHMLYMKRGTSLGKIAHGVTNSYHSKVSNIHDLQQVSGHTYHLRKNIAVIEKNDGTVVKT